MPMPSALERCIAGVQPASGPLHSSWSDLMQETHPDQGSCCHAITCCLQVFPRTYHCKGGQDSYIDQEIE